MKSISKLELSPSEWLALRKQSVGASDVAVLLGLNPYKTQYQLWEEKVLPEPIAQIENEATHFGNALEETVAQEYAARSLRKILRDNKIRIHEDIDFFTCNLDRVILPKNGEGRGVLECKTAGGYAVKHWDSEIPAMYYVQVQAQLAITGWTWGMLALLVDGRNFSMFEIERDDMFIRNMLAIVNSFWNDYVVTKLPPPATAADFDRMASHTGIVEANEAVLAACQQLAKVKADIKLLEDNEEQLKDKIKEAIGTADTLAHGGKTLATWKSAKDSKVFDIEGFRAAVNRPDLEPKFESLKPGSRRFLLK